MKSEKREAVSIAPLHMGASHMDVIHTKLLEISYPFVRYLLCGFHRLILLAVQNTVPFKEGIPPNRRNCSHMQEQKLTLWDWRRRPGLLGKQEQDERSMHVSSQNLHCLHI
jgi:hypothetical protein